MPLTNLITLLKDADKNNYAVPAFNVDNLESILAVTKAAKETGRPIIIQTIPKTLDYGGISSYPAMIKEQLKHCSIDYAIHLDHGNSLQLIKKCLNSGFTSVMYDGSSMPLENNINSTLMVCQAAHSIGASVEGELGTIGGKEQLDTDSGIEYTKTAEAIEFTERTNVDALAIGVGTCHGIYKGTPIINIQRIAEIHSAVRTPLVLHGASGLSDEVIKQCIHSGISKINFATELRQAFTNGLREILLKDAQIFDPKVYMPYAIEQIYKTAVYKINLCN